MPLTEQDIANALFQAGMGAESRLQQPGLARLGHPETGQIPADADTGIEGTVWCHAYGAPYALPGSEGDDREDDAGAPFVAILPLELRNIPLIPGQPVRTVREGSHVVITGTLPVEAHTYTGKEALQPAPQPVERWQLQYLTVRPNNPPDMGLTLVGGVVRVGDTLYSLPHRAISDLSSYLSGLTAGQAKTLLIAVDVTDLSIVITAGSAFTDNREAGVSDHHALFGDYPDTLASEDERALGYVKLYYGMTQIVTEDLYPVLDPGDGGGGGGAAEWSATDTANTPAAPGDLIGHWDYETGDLRLRNGSDPAGWLGPYNLPSIGTGGGGIDAGVKLIWTDTAEEIATSSSWQIGPWTYRPWDTDGFYDPGMGVLETVEGGIYDIELKVDFNVGSGTPLATMATVMPHIDVTLDEDGNTGSYGRKLVVPAGVDDSTTFLLQAVTTVRGRIADAEEIQAWMDNDLGDSIFVQRAELTLYRIQSPAFGTP